MHIVKKEFRLSRLFGKKETNFFILNHGPLKKSICLLIAFIVLTNARAQTLTENLVEGSKTLVELISVLKNKPAATTAKNAADSCAIKQLADLCFKNASSRNLAVSIYRRIEAAYETQPFTVKVLPKKQECLYELKSGIYKYRIEADSGLVKLLVSEGEFKLQACDNMKREIRE